MGDGTGPPVARQHNGIAREREKLAANRRKDGLLIATRHIGPADRLIKQCVPGEEDSLLCIVKANRTGGVTRRVQDMQ